MPSLSAVIDESPFLVPVALMGLGAFAAVVVSMYGSWPSARPTAILVAFLPVTVGLFGTWAQVSQLDANFMGLPLNDAAEAAYRSARWPTSAGLALTAVLLPVALFAFVKHRRSSQ